MILPALINQDWLVKRTKDINKSKIKNQTAGPNQDWLPRGNDRETPPQEECGKSLELKRFLSFLSFLPVFLSSSYF